MTTINILHAIMRLVLLCTTLISPILAQHYQCVAIQSPHIHEPAAYQSSLKNQQATDSISASIYVDEFFLDEYADAAAAGSYITQLTQRVSYIYEGIDIHISWTIIETPIHIDDYQSIGATLNELRAALPCDQHSDLSMLLSGTTGLTGAGSYTGGLFSSTDAIGMISTYGDAHSEDYSWDIHALAHEIGHILGASHTEDCVWGDAYDTAIDACGVPDICNTATIPEGGGTIMSNCHLNPVGVDLSQGFHPWVAHRIKRNVQLYRSQAAINAKTAIRHDIRDSLIIIPSFAEQLPSQHDGATKSRWIALQASQDVTISLSSCGEGVDTRLTLYQEDCQSLTEIAASDDDCYSGGLNWYAAEIGSIDLAQGQKYYIVADNKWSDKGYTITLTVEQWSDLCSNGIKDPTESGIDCGGSCAPCTNPMPKCTSETLPDTITQSTICHMNMELNYQGMVMDRADLALRSPVATSLKAGFAIEAGSTLEISTDTCEE